MLLSRYQSYKRLPSLQKGHVLLLQSSNWLINNYY
jgi:hypothetical protein